LLRATTGLGKTHGVLKAARLLRESGINLVRKLIPAGADDADAQAEPHVLAYLAPTRALAVETTDEAKRIGLRPFRIRSRLEEAPNGLPMCAKHDLTKQLYDAGLGRQAHRLCHDQDPETGEDIYCAHYDTCPFIAQRDELQEAVDRDDIDLVVSTHKRVLLGLPNGIAPWLTVIDERVDGKFPDIASVSLEHLSAPLGREGVQDDPIPWRIRDKLARELASRLYNSADIQTIAKTYANDPDLSRLERVDEALKAEADAGIDILPTSDPKQIAEVTARARAGAVLRAERKLWAIIRERAAAMAKPNTGVQDAPDAKCECEPDRRLTLRAGRLDGTGREIVIRTRKKVGQVFWKSPLLALDATGDVGLLQRCFPQHSWRDCEIRAEQPQLALVSVPDSTMADSSVTAHPNADDVVQARAQQRLQDLRAEISALSERHEELVVIATHGVRDALHGDEEWLPPANVIFAGFGDQRGLNRFKDADGFLVVGRVQPRLSVVDDHVAAYYGDDPACANQALLEGDQLPKVPGYWRVKTGEVLSKAAPQAPTELAARILFQFREANLLQAIGRARGVGRASKATVYVRTALPLPVTWDRVITARDLRGDHCPLQAAFESLGNILPLTPSVLAHVSTSAFAEKLSENACRHRLAPITFRDVPADAESSLCAIARQPAIVEAAWHGTRGQPRRFLVDATRGVGEAEERCRRFL
jgi:hypothetical protein